MKEYLNKHKFRIIFLSIIIVLSVILIPNEKKHYLIENINDFKENVYWNIMKIVSIIIIVFVIIYKKIYKYNLKEIIITFLKLIAICLVFSHLLQNVILSLLLYTNRLKSNENITRKYIVVDKIENQHFIAKELNSEKVITERDYFRQNKKIEINNIKINDTIKINTYKGIFGIEFY